MMDLELLAPAGSPESLIAAVQSGADAVYLGYGDFHARRNAKNFSPEDLSAALSYCRLRRVKVYLTVNTLITDRELPKASETAAFAARCGIDAILVQDVGLARILRETIPDVPLHASTQMTIHNLPGIQFCASLGLTRVVLSRELSRDAIAVLCRQSPLEVEVFVHGALCMGYSGQCYFSALVGGRSGNRGLCAQPCRLAYRWEEDKRTTFPLSLKDLSLAGHLQDLADMGVSCLKLEGRMKRPEYVAIVTKIYADALREKREPTTDEQKQLALAFSRDGFTQGYYLDRKGPAMFGRRKESEVPPKQLFDQAKERYTRFENTSLPIRFSARIQTGQPVTITVSDEDGNQRTVTGAIPEAALSRALTSKQVEAQLSKTGGTVFSCTGVDVQLDPDIALPLSALNALRRNALEALSILRSSPPERTILPFSPSPRLPNSKDIPSITLSVFQLNQLSPALLEGLSATLYLPVEEIVSQPDTVAAFRTSYPGIHFAVQLPRIVWDRELPLLREQLLVCRRLGLTDALIGNWGLISLCQDLGFRMRGDFGLGVCNSRTLEELSRLGFVSAAASFELNLAQVRDLSKVLDTELLAYGRLSMMLTENCLFRNRDDACHCPALSHLVDRKGLSFPVVKAWGCRSEILNAKTLFLADKQEDYHNLGLWAVRLSFTTEPPEECAAILKRYLGRGSASPAELTRGLYYRKVE